MEATQTDMKFATILPTLAGALVLAGCDNPALISLEPAVTAQDAVFDPSLVGTWETGQGDELCIFRHGDGNSYTITYVGDDGNSRKFDALLFQSGPARLLDLSPHESDDFQIPGHTLIRIWTTGGSLRWSFLDSAWLREQAAQELPNRSRGGDKLALTAPSAALRGFLAKYAADDKAHGEISELQRGK